MKQQRSIGKVLLICIVMASSVITSLFTAISFYFDYKNELSDLDDKFDQIEIVSMKPVARSLFVFSIDQVKAQIDGIVGITDVISASVIDSSSETEFYRAEKDEVIVNRNVGIRQAAAHSLLRMFSVDLTPKSREYVLHSPEDKHVIGTLQVFASIEEIYVRLITEAMFFFATQFFKTAIVSLLIMGIFRIFLVRHLGVITNAIEFFEVDSTTQNKPLRLNRTIGNTTDELDILVSKINQMTKAIYQNNMRQKDEVLAQQVMIERSAKLASVGEMAGGIVHEINNPLGIIAEYNRVISRLSDDQEVSHATKKIESTIGRMEKIMHGLLHFSHNDENESFDVVRAESYMDQIQGIVTIRLKKFYIPLEIIYEKLGRDATFACRSIQFSQVIVILVNNAIDAISDLEESERWIKIYCSVDKEFAEFRIVDSGDGVPDELKAKIMDPYFTTKSTGEGTGLGLSIASKIVKSHGGTIEIGSGLPSTFCVKIPVKNPEIS